MQAPVATAPAVFMAHSIALQTERAHHFVDLTHEILGVVEDSGIWDGLLVVASRHTTASIVVNEHEPELLKDLDLMLAGLAPEESDYGHNEVPCLPGERPNGHAHCQALLLSTSVSLPIVGGKLMLGRYQRIFLLELDCPRPRVVSVVALGS